MTTKADVKFYREDLAREAGLKSVRSLPPRRARIEGSAWVLPEPEGVDVADGHARPWWRGETVREWLAARPGPGRWR